MEKIFYIKTLELIEKKGFKFTTEDLAKTLSTSKRTIYTYFSSKDEIIEKTIDFVFDEISKSDAEILNNEQLTLVQKITLYFQNIPDTYNLSSITKYMDELQRFYPEQWEKVNTNLNTFWNDIIKLIEEGIKTDELKEINSTILKIILTETYKKLLNSDFLSDKNISFNSGLKAISDIILYGIVTK